MIIGLDPGHGGNAPGNVNKDFIEKEFNLEIAQLITDKLRFDQNIQIVVSRNEDVTLSLSERRKKLLNLDAEFIISIHADSVSDIRNCGMCIYRQFNGVLAAEQVASEIIKNYVKKGGIYTDEEGRTHERKQHIFVCSPKRPWTIRASNVLKGYPEDSAILIECGYASNPNECTWLMSNLGKTSIVDAIVCGINWYVTLKKGA
jgi:N-acetylmuramoyl-L-alanine amidase